MSDEQQLLDIPVEQAKDEFAPQDTTTAANVEQVMRWFRRLFDEYKTTGDEEKLMAFVEGWVRHAHSMANSARYAHDRKIQAENDVTYLRSLLQRGVDGLRAVENDER